MVIALTTKGPDLEITKDTRISEEIIGVYLRLIGIYSNGKRDFEIGHLKDWKPQYIKAIRQLKRYGYINCRRWL